jgi:hypothetical protein
MAARGTCNMDAGEKPLADSTLIEQLRVKARRVHLRALITAIAITLLALAFPAR